MLTSAFDTPSHSPTSDRPSDPVTSRSATPRIVVTPLRSAEYTALDALVLFENGITPDGHVVNDLALDTFPTSIQHYWTEHPDPKRRVGKVFVTTTDQTPRFLIHLPLSLDTHETPPLATLHEQLRQMATFVNEHALTRIGVYAVQTTLLHGRAFTGVLQALFEGTTREIIVYDA